MVRAGQTGFIYDLCVWREIQRGYRKVRCRRVIYVVSKENSKESKSPSIFREFVFDLTTTHQIAQNGHFGNSNLQLKSNQRVPKDLKANGRGSFDFRIDLNSSLRLIKWYDNKAVILGSTFSSVQSTSDKQRWDAKKKEHCKIKYPYIVKDQNQSMGGVDLSDMLTSLYLIDIQSRKRWFLKIFTHLLNICNVNDWLLYRRHSDQLDIPKAKQLTLLQFTKAVAYGLLLARKNPN